MDTLKREFDISLITFSFNKCRFSNMVYDSLFTNLFILLDSAVNKISKIVILKKKLFIFQINFKIICERLDYSNKVHINTECESSDRANESW